MQLFKDNLSLKATSLVHEDARGLVARKKRGPVIGEKRKQVDDHPSSHKSSGVRVIPNLNQASKSRFETLQMRLQQLTILLSERAAISSKFDAYAGHERNEYSIALSPGDATNILNIQLPRVGSSVNIDEDLPLTIEDCNVEISLLAERLYQVLGH